MVSLRLLVEAGEHRTRSALGFVGVRRVTSGKAQEQGQKQSQDEKRQGQSGRSTVHKAGVRRQGISEVVMRTPIIATAVVDEGVGSTLTLRHRLVFPRGVQIRPPLLDHSH